MKTRQRRMRTLEDPKLARLYSILESIASSGFYTKDSDDEEDLPEYKAWAWLSKRDMSVDTNRESTPDWKIVERYVLAAFFYATNGEEWNNTNDFLSPSPVCDWKGQNEFHYGVRFCSDEGSVTMLHIPANNLEGPIPTLLGLLINLVSLDLPGNSLAGTLPSELSKLTRLTGKLDLSRNLLTGTISSSIGRLVDLTELHLNENRLDGAIPTEIALMTSLTTLHLSSNQMTDGIPHELGRLDRLEDLRLDDNMLSGRLPSSIGNMSNIIKLHLHQNQLSGTVPSSFSQLQNRCEFRRQTTFA
jgi:Leucine-rich repeat (LRR) protein